MSEPERTQVRPVLCHCRMRTGGGWDSCASLTSGPDEPICVDCVREGHPDDPTFDPRPPNLNEWALDPFGHA